MGLKHSLLALVAIFLVSSPLASAGNVTVNLNLNNTQGTVRLPGAGSFPAGQSSGMFSDPSRYYIASYLNNMVYGLVFSYQSPLYIMSLPISGGHTLRMASDSQNSNILLTFTRGDWRVRLMGQGSTSPAHRNPDRSWLTVG